MFTCFFPLLCIVLHFLSSPSHKLSQTFCCAEAGSRPHTDRPVRGCRPQSLFNDLPEATEEAPSAPALWCFLCCQPHLCEMRVLPS